MGMVFNDGSLAGTAAACYAESGKGQCKTDAIPFGDAAANKAGGRRAGKERKDMQIGEVIRTYRKKMNLTQEEMACRLGVTAPAVNKWENGNSYPDILLLAPIARLLGISPDTLLSFREELTAEEIGETIRRLDAMLKERPYEEAFYEAKKMAEQYPNCGQLLWQIAVIFDAQSGIQGRKSEEDDAYLLSLYRRALECGDEKLRGLAAGSLFGFYMRKGRCGEAEECLAYLPQQDPERKRLLARLYGETGRAKEAYKAYEELLFSCYQTVNAALWGMSALALREDDWERARQLAAKQEEMAVCFEMGPYYEAAGWLELAVREKDVEKTLATAQKLLEGIEKMGSFCRAPLYEHMAFREGEEGFFREMKERLKQSFFDEERCGFLKGDERWRKLTGQKGQSQTIPAKAF